MRGGRTATGAARRSGQQRDEFVERSRTARDIELASRPNNLGMDNNNADTESAEQRRERTHVLDTPPGELVGTLAVAGGEPRMRVFEAARGDGQRGTLGAARLPSEREHPHPGPAAIMHVPFR